VTRSKSTKFKVSIFSCFFFQSPLMSVRVVGEAAHHGPPPLPTFYLAEDPSASIQNPLCSLPSVFVVVVVPPAFSLSLSQENLFGKPFLRRFAYMVNPSKPVFLKLFMLWRTKKPKNFTVH